MPLVLRSEKGSELSHAEMDANWLFLRGQAHNLGATLTGAQTMNADNGALQYGTVTGAVTWTFSGAALSGRVTTVTLALTNGGSATQTWPASVVWDEGSAPTLKAAGFNLIEFITYDGGTTWRGSLSYGKAA